MTTRILICAAAVAWSATCLAEFKVIDFQRAVLSTIDGQKAKKTLEAEFKKRQEALQKMDENMRKMSEEFERKATSLAQSAREREQLKLKAEMRKFQESAARAQQDMTRRQKELLEPIAQKLNAIVSALATKKGIKIVLEKTQVVFSNSDLDMTDEVVQAYDKG